MFACAGGSGSGGHLTVFAAASLTAPFSDAQPSLPAGLSVTYNFAGSQQLAQLLEQSAPADVVATADMVTMQHLVDEGIVEQPVVFARNRLEILVAAGNPDHVESLADLARPDVTVVLCDEAVPAGRYASQVLRRADVEVTPKSLEPDVKSAVARVLAGEADATIVYATDVRDAGTRAAGVEIGPDDNIVAEYPIAIVKATTQHAAANRFIEAVRSGAVRDALRAHGFEV